VFGGSNTSRGQRSMPISPARCLAAVASAALEVSIAAASQAGVERVRRDKRQRQRWNALRYAVGRARRQYQLAEPETRLVVRQPAG